MKVPSPNVSYKRNVVIPSEATPRTDTLSTLLNGPKRVCVISVGADAADEDELVLLPVLGADAGDGDELVMLSALGVDEVTGDALRER